jgi:hypothetical protein
MGTTRKVTLQLLSLQIFAQPNVRGNVAAAIVKPTKDYPYDVMEISEGNLRRISARTLGINSAVGLKLAIDASNGSDKLSIDMEERKAGDTFEKANGEKGTIQKDHIAWNNHEVQLGLAAQTKLMEIALGSAYSVAPTISAPKASVVVDEKKDEAPTV